MRGRGLLAVLAVGSLAAFGLQRARSPFLRIEAARGEAAAIAAEVGLTVDEVLALWELLGADLVPAELRTRAARFVADRAGFGGSEALAALAAAGHRPLAEQLLAAAGGDPARAELDLRPRPEAIAAVRFRTVRERFASRAGR